MTAQGNHNIALKLPQLAQELGSKPAVKFGGMKPEKNQEKDPEGNPKKNGEFTYQSLSFVQLENRSNFLAHKLLSIGLRPGMKVLMFVRPSLNFSAITFALFRAGLVPIFIDPGMGKENLLRAVAHIKPDGLIAEKQVHWIRQIYRSSFASIKHFVTISGSTWWNIGGQLHSLEQWLSKEGNEERKTPTIMHQAHPQDPAAILFTSGGTGIPKGVLYTHDIFNAQVDRLQKLFHLGPDEVDLPGFPLFSLFTITMGMTSAIPSMDPSHPAQANAEFLVKNINDNKATFIAGSPAIWKNVAAYCQEKKITLPTVKYLVMFGAPIALALHEAFEEILPNGDTYTPYGATECLPVANISGKELSGEIKTKMLHGMGTCVGNPAPDTEIKIIQITDEVIGDESEFTELPPKRLGEICVLSRTVTPEYVGMAEKTAEAKVKAHNGALWHRMGDIGFKDEQGRLWFCGRKSHRIDLHDRVLPTIPMESLINQIPGVKKSALVCPQEEPIIVIEGKRTAALETKIKERIAEDDRLSEIKGMAFLSDFPVDVRHNIKIDRLKIRELAKQGRLQ